MWNTTEVADDEILASDEEWVFEEEDEEEEQVEKLTELTVEKSEQEKWTEVDAAQEKWTEATVEADWQPIEPVVEADTTGNHV